MLTISFAREASCSSRSPTPRAWTDAYSGRIGPVGISASHWHLYGFGRRDVASQIRLKLVRLFRMFLRRVFVYEHRVLPARAESVRVPNWLLLRMMLAPFPLLFACLAGLRRRSSLPGSKARMLNDKLLFDYVGSVDIVSRLQASVGSPWLPRCTVASGEPGERFGLIASLAAAVVLFQSVCQCGLRLTQRRAGVNYRT